MHNLSPKNSEKTRVDMVKLTSLFIDAGGFTSFVRLTNLIMPLLFSSIDWICPERLTSVPDVPDNLPQVSVSAMVICPPGVAIRPGSHLAPLYPPVDFHNVEQAEPVPESDPSDACLLPKTLGPCEGFQEAWFFDLKTRRCRKFKTGGPGKGIN